MGEVPQYIFLAAGNKMPTVGLGTWQSSPEDTMRAVNEALDAGYRLIDTALAYNNEQAIGDALKQRFQSGKNKREDIFITTKAAAGLLATPELVRRSFEKSLAYLQVDYVDLYLLHVPIALEATPDEDPFPLTSRPIGFDHLAAWKVLEQLVDEGKVKAIGLSNFNSEQIEKVRAAARIPISNLQVECHLYHQQKELFQFCKERNISFTSYSSLGSPGKPAHLSKDDTPGPLDQPLIQEVAKKYNKTPAQILLRHLMQLGMAVIPKSVTPSRIKQNFQVFDFVLSNEDMQALSNFKIKKRYFTLDRIPGMKDVPGYPYNIPF